MVRGGCWCRAPFIYGCGNFPAACRTMMVYRLGLYVFLNFSQCASCNTLQLSSRGGREQDSAMSRSRAMAIKENQNQNSHPLSPQATLASMLHALTASRQGCQCHVSQDTAPPTKPTVTWPTTRALPTVMWPLCPYDW